MKPNMNKKKKEIRMAKFIIIASLLWWYPIIMYIRKLFKKARQRTRKINETNTNKHKD